jgi:hypothetical protein
MLIASTALMLFLYLEKESFSRARQHMTPSIMAGF